MKSLKNVTPTELHGPVLIQVRDDTGLVELHIKYGYSPAAPDTREIIKLNPGEATELANLLNEVAEIAGDYAGEG